ncbi:MAG: YebC/PmpR family DNA-binding transcriptional regulator [Candidatus Falkowbacteria bacterium]|nr:YebC/PmpR family DNA-binding transcriptional regulator [Candidatus Falkowbacteria bacterium]
MSGHSKWATTHRQKAIVDAKRGAVFTKLANIITIAARERGGDPNANASLRLAIDKARMSNMPKDNIDRAIKRGTGELGGAQVEELYYEGLGPVGVQFIVKCLTDNKNRSASSVRHLFTKVGGSFGSVMWNFSQLGVIRINQEELQAKNINSDDLELALIDEGIIDFQKEVEGITIYTLAHDLHKIREQLESRNLKITSADLEYVAKEKVRLVAEGQEKIDKFMEELEDNEDINDYYTNLA